MSYPYKHLASLLKIMSELGGDVRRIRIPILVIQGAHDVVAHPKSGDMIYRRVKTPKENKRMLKLRNTGHIPMVDIEKGKVFEESVKFIGDMESEYLKSKFKDTQYQIRRRKMQQAD